MAAFPISSTSWGSRPHPPISVALSSTATMSKMSNLREATKSVPLAQESTFRRTALPIPKVTG